MSGIITDQPGRIVDTVKELDVPLWQRAIRLALTELLTGQDYYDADDILLAMHRDVVMDLEERAARRPASH